MKCAQVPLLQVCILCACMHACMAKLHVHDIGVAWFKNIFREDEMEELPSWMRSPCGLTSKQQSILRALAFPIVMLFSSI